MQSFLGGRQFWILVHDEDSAHKCIDYIKKANVGRATFLPLNRANPRRKALNFSPNGTDVIGWLIELIDYDAKWDKGVMHLLGNLLLVRDYERGAQISRTHKAFPVVTLEGEVFLPSGTISGGGVVEPSKNVLDLKNSLREKINAIKTLRGEIKQLNLALTREEKRE
ncbi:MAG: chromosome segregation protein SMC, partial [Acetomicrobium sp.]